MAWLVRAAGIPARVAFGFTNGSKRDGDTYTLTNRNLHAWTEVYFDGSAGCRSTPPRRTACRARPGRPGRRTPTRRSRPPRSTGATDAPTGPDASAGPAGAGRTADRDTDAGLSTSAATHAGRASHRSGPGGRRALLALLALLAVPALRRLALRRRRAGRAAPVAAAVAGRRAPDQRGARGGGRARTPTGPARTRTPPGTSCSTRWSTSGSGSTGRRRPGRPPTGWSGRP